MSSKKGDKVTVTKKEYIPTFKVESEDSRA